MFVSQGTQRRAVTGARSSAGPVGEAHADGVDLYPRLLGGRCPKVLDKSVEYVEASGVWATTFTLP